jgi:hypothetical protein
MEAGRPKEECRMKKAESGWNLDFEPAIFAFTLHA